MALLDLFQALPERGELRVAEVSTEPRDDFDLDFPIQTILIPGTNMVITGCKDDSLYVMDRNNMGKYDPLKNKVLQTK